MLTRCTGPSSRSCRNYSRGLRIGKTFLPHIFYNRLLVASPLRSCFAPNHRLPTLILPYGYCIAHIGWDVTRWPGLHEIFIVRDRSPTSCAGSDRKSAGLIEWKFVDVEDEVYKQTETACVENLCYLDYYPCMCIVSISSIEASLDRKTQKLEGWTSRRFYLTFPFPTFPSIQTRSIHSYLYNYSFFFHITYYKFEGCGFWCTLMSFFAIRFPPPLFCAKRAHGRNITYTELDKNYIGLEDLTPFR